jgi:hypothetical protein
MKISSKDFRVQEGDEVNLEKWPTKVDAVYKSKEQSSARARSTIGDVGFLTITQEHKDH